MISTIPQPIWVSTGEGFHFEFFRWLDDQRIQWRPDPDISFLENLYEFAGRLCYESWTLKDGSFVNKNLKKIRSGNFDYLKNILIVDHGSVLEHGGIVVLFFNVSRVFTHELVRHRVGTAMSQTSGRYVRNDNIKFWTPPSLTDHKNGGKIVEVGDRIISQIENGIKEITVLLELNDPSLNFTIKKQLTSALRRYAPNGQSNNILFSFNGRSLRHIFKMRASKAAEEEMRFVIPKLAKKAKDVFPNLLLDLEVYKDYCEFVSIKK